MKPIVWKCPYCYTPHQDAFIRCTGCGDKRSKRYEVDAAGNWIDADPTDGQPDMLGCYSNPTHPMRIK